MSNARPAGEPSSPNLRIDPLTTPEVVKFLHCENDDANLPSAPFEDINELPTTNEHASPDNSTSSYNHTLPITHPNDLVGSTFLLPQEDSQCLWDRIVKVAHDYERDL